MLLPPDLPVVDHHCHLSPSGEGVRAAIRFARAGGSHLFLTAMNWTRAPILKLDQYREQFEGMEALAARIRREAGIFVHLVVAPYPIDLLSSAEALGVGPAVALQKEALDLAGRWVTERKAVALGEVGRAHFAVPDPLRDAIDEVFRHALAIARQSGCPAVVHCGDLDAAGYAELADLAKASGLPRGRLVKHYARGVVSEGERAGIVPSFLARRETVRAALPTAPPWFLETDFLDDPERPGAVLDLVTVPKRTLWVATMGSEAIERLRIPFQESIEAVYGFRPERPERTP